MKSNAERERLRITVSVLAALVSPIAFGQVRGLEAGSVDAARVSYGNRRRSLEMAESWRTSKKLTVLEEIPESPQPPDDRMPPKNLTTGSIGYLEYWQYEVLQVVGPKDVLLVISNPDIPPVWLTGHPTKDLADGDDVRLVGLVEVIGTKAYRDATGIRKTVRLLRLIGRKRMAEMKAAAAARRTASKEDLKKRAFARELGQPEKGCTPPAALAGEWKGAWRLDGKGGSIWIRIDNQGVVRSLWGKGKTIGSIRIQAGRIICAVSGKPDMEFLPRGDKLVVLGWSDEERGFNSLADGPDYAGLLSRVESQ